MPHRIVGSEEEEGITAGKFYKVHTLLILTIYTFRFIGFNKPYFIPITPSSGKDNPVTYWRGYSRGPICGMAVIRHRQVSVYSTKGLSEIIIFAAGKKFTRQPSSRPFEPRFNITFHSRRTSGQTSSTSELRLQT